MTLEGSSGLGNAGHPFEQPAGVLFGQGVHRQIIQQNGRNGLLSPHRVGRTLSRDKISMPRFVGEGRATTR